MVEHRRAFICGHPVAHSRSPLIHGHWLAEHGLEGSYERVDVAPDALPKFMAELGESGFCGGNITIPHKETAFTLVERRDAAAEAIGAVNTLWFEDGQLHGGNTDAYGYAAHLDAVAPQWRQGKTAVVLGAGGAARAIIHALQQAGYSDIRIVNRTVARAHELADRLHGGTSAHGWEELGELLGEADLLVNTSALGMAGKPPLDVALAPLPGHAIVSDIVYVPLKTDLLARAEARGLKSVDGLGMLLHQAVPGFERWFDVRPQVTDALRAIVVGDLGGKA